MDNTAQRPTKKTRWWRWIAIGAASLIVVVLAGSFIYTKILNDAPAALGEDDLTAAVTDQTTATTSADAEDTAVADTAGAAGAATSDSTTVDGEWSATTASILRYRVSESINGFDTEAVGETNAITGSLTITGSTATAGEFTVDMTTFESDDSQRDRQFDGRVMIVDEYPTATFVLTQPIDFGWVPAAGETVTATATGELTLHGVTNTVTFELTATLGDNSTIGVLGNIPVLFADYDIDNPSFGTITTEDNGLLEFVLVFEKD